MNLARAILADSTFEQVQVSFASSSKASAKARAAKDGTKSQPFPVDGM